MEIWEKAFEWFRTLITDLDGITKFLSFSIEINGTSFNVFTILTITGLLVYLAIAIVKWLVA